MSAAAATATWNPLSRAGGEHVSPRLPRDHLRFPLRWRRARRVLVKGDLFHAAFVNEEIAAVFAVMATAAQHTFDVRTAHPQRMREWRAWLTSNAPPRGTTQFCPLWNRLVVCAGRYLGEYQLRPEPSLPLAWPLANVTIEVVGEQDAGGRG